MTTTNMVADYEIGGLSVRMTERQAERWNSGDFTERDQDAVLVAIPKPVNDADYITLRRAMSERLSPATARMMSGKPANRISEFHIAGF